MILSLLLVAAMVLPSALMGQGSKTNFAGSWLYDAARSNTGQQQGQNQRPAGQNRPGMGGGDFTVKQDGNVLTVERTMKAPDGTVSTMTSKYTLDGSESVNSTRGGESKSVATWSSDGKTLTIKTTRTMNRGGETRTMKSTEVWSLSDPKTLTLEMTMPTPNGERKMTSVYTKK